MFSIVSFPKGPIIIDSKLSTVVKVAWNSDGSIFAVAGTQRVSADKDVNVVDFYSPFGEVRFADISFVKKIRLFFLSTYEH